MTSDQNARPAEQVDFELVFNLTPGMCLVLDAGFTILADQGTQPLRAKGGLRSAPKAKAG